MTIKEFCETYNKLATQLQDKFIKDNIKFKKYVPFMTKVAYAETLAKVSMIDQESGNVHVNSPAAYLQFCRAVIQLYTDLEIETSSFYEEYDLLKSTGLLDKLIVGEGQEGLSLIPANELAEFKTLCDMAKSDVVTNKLDTRAFIEDQVDRFALLTSSVLAPVLDGVKDSIVNLDDAKVKKWIKPVVAAINKQMKTK